MNGGGDHTLNGSKDQFAVSLSLELILQALKIPYDVCRGSLNEPSFMHFFDGQSLRAQTEDSALFEDFVL